MSVESIKQHTDAILALDIKQLERKGQDFNFTEVRNELNELQDISARINEGTEVGPEFLSEEQVNQLANRLNGVKQILDQVAAYDPKNIEGSPKTVQQDLITKIRDQLRALKDGLMPIHIALLLGSRSSSAGEELVAKQKELVSESKNLLSEIQNQAKKVQAEQEQIIKTARATAGEVGVTQYGTIFETQADKYNVAANWWLGVLIVSIIGGGWFLYLTVKALTSQELSLETVLLKILVTSVVYFVIYQAAKTHNANRHLSVMNRHKANALKVFKTMHEAGEQPEIRDAVLVKAAAAIFDPGDSGFIGRDPGESPTSDTIKLITGLGGDKK